MVMKITGGKFKGRNVEARKDQSLRPTTGRVREAVFNMLMHGKFLNDERFKNPEGRNIIEGQKVVDIFCGTGILGLEAVSRGAEHATLIDQNQSTIDIAWQNINNTGANARVIKSDSTRLPRAVQKCTLAFLDPPYNSGLSVPALKSLRDQGWLANGAIVILEHSNRDDFIAPEKFVVLDDRDYNKTRITLMQYQE